MGQHCQKMIVPPNLNYNKYTCVDDTLKCFEWLENYRKLSDPTTINLVKMYLRFLKTFLLSAEKLWTKQELSTKQDTYHINYVEDWVENAGKTVQSLCANAVEESKVTEAWHGKIKDLTSKIRISYRSVLQLDATLSDICLVELIDSVSNNLNDVLGHKTKSIHDSIKKQIDILQVKFQFLRNFAWFRSKKCIEHHKLEDILRIIEVVATTTACLLFQCLFEETDTAAETKFSQVLLKIQLIEPELRSAYFRSLESSMPLRLENTSNPMVIEDAIGFLCCFLNDLKELLSPKAFLMASASDHVCKLCEELNLLVAFLMDSHKMDGRENLLARTKTVVTKTAHVIHLLLVSSKNEDVASGDDPYRLFDLLNEIDSIKKEIITKNYLQHRKSIRSNLIPKVNSLGLIDFLLGIVNVVLNNKTYSIDFARHQLEIVKDELVSLRSFCVRDLETDITDVVHDAKHAISNLIIRESPRWHCLLQLSNVIIKIQDVKNKVAANFVRDQIVEIGGSTGAQNSDSSSEKGNGSRS